MWENWNKCKVFTVSIQNVEYVDFYHYPKPPKGASKLFRLKPERVEIAIDLPLSSENKGIRVNRGKVNATQMPVNCSIATICGSHAARGVQGHLNSKFMGLWVWKLGVFCVVARADKIGAASQQEFWLEKEVLSVRKVVEIQRDIERKVETIS